MEKTESKFGEVVQAEVNRIYARCEDGEGYVDHEEVDYYLSHVDHEVQQYVDVMEVYLEEALRFS